MNPELAADAVHELVALSPDQLGLVARRQLELRGVTRSAIRNLVATNRVVEEDAGVFRVNGAPMGDRVRARGATLAAGPSAMLSHSSAAALWGLPGYRVAPIHLTVVRGNNPVWTRHAKVHRHRSLASVPAAILDGLPVVRPEVLALQICATSHPDHAERMFDRLWSERLLSGASTRQVLGTLSTRGLNGVSALRQILQTRPNDYVPPASGLEGRVVRLLADAGLPPMERQVDLGGTETWCGRVDFYDRDRRLVLEVDSERFHSALTDVADDRRRQERLQSAGFTVVRVTDFQVWHRPAQVIATVRSGSAAAGSAKPSR